MTIFKLSRVHVGCSTGLCLTIHIEEKLFDDLLKLGCVTGIYFYSNYSNKILFELN